MYTVCVLLVYRCIPPADRRYIQTTHAAGWHPYHPFPVYCVCVMQYLKNLIVGALSFYHYISVTQTSATCHLKKPRYVASFPLVKPQRVYNNMASEYLTLCLWVSECVCVCVCCTPGSRKGQHMSAIYTHCRPHVNILCLSTVQGVCIHTSVETNLLQSLCLR